MIGLCVRIVAALALRLARDRGDVVKRVLVDRVFWCRSKVVQLKRDLVGVDARGTLVAAVGLVGVDDSLVVGLGDDVRRTLAELIVEVMLQTAAQLTEVDENRPSVSEITERTTAQVALLISGANASAISPASTS